MAGSRKELAASVIRLAAKDGRRVNAQEVDWVAIETNPREAKELITKSNLFGDVSWGNLREQGMQPGAGFLIDRVYASVGTEPAEDSPQARKDYAFGLQTIRERLERCKSVDDVVKVVEEMRDESRGSMLTDEDADRYQALSAQATVKLNERHDLNATKDAAYNVTRSARNMLSAAEYDIRRRERRKWKVPPEMVTALEAAKVHVEAAEKKWESVWGSVKEKLDPLENDIRALQRDMHDIREIAVIRNATENPLTRAWNVLGTRFNSVLNFRSSTFIYRNKRTSGSEAFRSHVVSAKVDKIKDWAWAEKEGGIKVKQEKKESVRFQLKVADKFDRVGGRKIKPESTVDLKDRFNLREVQSGNWVLRDPVSAKFHVEHTAEAFADLADIIGVPDSDVSMNGRLAMAFGARGAGAKGWKDSAAMAHYEPVHRIINLTKMGGGGSLGHEWAHALDNMIKEAVTGETGGKDDFASEDPTLLPSGELRDAFMAVRSAMLDGNEKAPEKFTYTDSDIRLADHNINRTSVSGLARSIKEAGNAEAAVKAVDDYYAGRTLTTRKSIKAKNDWRRIAVAYHDRQPSGVNGSVVKWVKAGGGMSKFAVGARELDQGGNMYWESRHEMFARAFQSYIEDTLASKGQKNDYLSSYADNKYHVDQLLGIQWKPYPEGEERERINIAMERLFAAVRKHDVLAKAAAMFDEFMVG